MIKLLRKFRKNKDGINRKLNKVKSSTLKLSLIMFNFIFATFAWFTYTKILDTSVDVNVSAWKVSFKDDASSLGSELQFQVGNFYPGMNDYVKEIEIQNLGDRAASIEYQIGDLKLLGRTYTISGEAEGSEEEEGEEEGAEGVEGEEGAEGSEGAEGGAESSEDYFVVKSETLDPTTGNMVVKLLNDASKFPFEITITYSPRIDIADASDPDKNKGVFEIRFTWPYEIEGTPEEIAQKNALDTKWGHDIAKFYQNLPAGDTTQGIEISLNAIAKQII